MSAGDDEVAGPGPRLAGRRRWWLVAGVLAGVLAGGSLGFLAGLARPHTRRPR